MDSFAELESALLNVEYINKLNQQITRFANILKYNESEIVIVNRIESMYDEHLIHKNDQTPLITLIYDMISIIDKKTNILRKVISTIDHINGEEKCKYIQLRYMMIESLTDNTRYRDELIDLLVELNP